MHEASAIDSNGGPEERAAARAKDTEKRWQDVSSETFLANQDVFHFLDAKGFRYYLPALMVWNLRFIGTAGHEHNSYVIESLENVLQETDYLLGHFQSLTLEQARAVAHFLEFHAERDQLMLADSKSESGKIMSDLGFSEQQIDLFLSKKSKVSFAASGAQQALDLYWGQFLDWSEI
ncbi:hypothetical protein EON80_21565 [bacterium]|nr:MAG: hypothetical protein EON80_21565 [bacterium]